MNDLPLVSLGVPVRNGAALLGAALESIVNQDYANIEVIIADNASTDTTNEVAESYARRFPFVRVVRHERPLAAIDNFLFVMNEAKGEFFAWCAHDDTRSSDFISGLLPAFEDRSTVLAFGDLYVWDGKNQANLQPKYRFATDGLRPWRRLRKAALMQCFHVYGLWRTQSLKSLSLRRASWWPDLPIMMGMAVKGTFRYVPGVTFKYLEVVKSTEERAQNQDYRAAASPIENLADVFRACSVTVTHVAGIWYGFLAFVFVMEKFSRQLLRTCAQRLQRSACSTGALLSGKAK